MKEYPIIDWPFTKADCYWTKKTCSRKGIQVHSVGCKGTLAARWEKSWNRPGRLTCGGYIIDINNIYRVLQEGHRCWLSSSGPKGNANNDYLGFEICEPSKKDDTPEAAADLYGKTLYLCAYLAKKYNINPAMIQTHCELHALGIANNHADVKHWWGKKGTSWEPYTMDRLRAEVSAETGIPIRYCTEIKRGYVGDAAKLVQKVLSSLGYEVPVDGTYGYKTANSMKAYQKDNKLPVNGVCGPAVWDKIYADINKPVVPIDLTQQHYIGTVKTKRSGNIGLCKTTSKTSTCVCKIVDGQQVEVTADCISGTMAPAKYGKYTGYVDTQYLVNRVNIK